MTEGLQGARRGAMIFQELVQLVPVITFASSFIVGGGVDLSRAAPLFVLAAGLAVVITAYLVARGIRLNPILVGTNLWLCVGALAFGLPLAPLAELIGRLQAVGLFACALAVGLVLTVVSPGGYIGLRHPDRRLIRTLSVVLLGLTVGALAWSWIYVENIRLGGGLPFIVLNVLRRVILRRVDTLR